MKLKNLLVLFFGAAFLFLSGCASTNSPNSAAGGAVIVDKPPPATFKLSSYQLKWIDSAVLETELRCAISSVNLQKVCSSSGAAKARSESDVALMKNLLAEHAPTQLKTLLSERGLREGTESTIELSPSKGYWSESGWGSGVIVSVKITEHATGKSWAHVIPADSGIQLFGAMAASPQTPQYAKTFAQRVVQNLQSVELIK